MAAFGRWFQGCGTLPCSCMVVYDYYAYNQGTLRTGYTLCRRAGPSVVRCYGPVTVDTWTCYSDVQQVYLLHVDCMSPADPRHLRRACPCSTAPCRGTPSCSLGTPDANLARCSLPPGCTVDPRPPRVTCPRSAAPWRGRTPLCSSGCH